MLVFTCSKKETPAPEAVALPGFELPLGGTLWLGLASDGNYVPWPLPETAQGQAEIQPSNFAVHLGPAAIEPLPGGGAILASNRSGLHFLSLVQPSPLPAEKKGNKAATEATTIPNPRFVFDAVRSADPAFAKRTVMGSWIFGGKAMVLLSRNPVFETEPFEAPGYSFLSADSRGSSVWEMPGSGDFAVYACYPSSPDSWVVQLRKDSDDRVDMLYERWSPDEGKRQVIGRDVFERAVMPASITKAPEALQQLAAHVPESLIVNCKMPDGSRMAFSKPSAQPTGGDEDALNAYAQIRADGALLVAEDGRGFYQTKGQSRTIAIPRALPDAMIRDAAIVDGVLVIIWEEDLFPDVGDCGLLIFNLGL